MSSPNWTATSYPFESPDQLPAGEWVLWDSDASNPLVVSFPSSLPVRTIWIPAMTGPVRFYEGDTATGTPFYTSPSGNASETVPMPDGFLSVTLVGSGGDMYVYASSALFSPFRNGPLGAQISSITVDAPLASTGGSNPTLSLETPLAIAYGGTGTASPVGVSAGAGISVAGSFPNQTVGVVGTLGTVTAVTASAPLSSTGGNTPNISMTVPLGLNYGGTGQTAPALNSGAGISVTGNVFQPTGGSKWTVTNIGVTSLTGDSGPTATGDLTIHGTGNISTSISGGTMSVSGALLALVGNGTSTGIHSSTLTVTPSGQNVDIELPGTILPIYKIDGTEIAGGHIVYGDAAVIFSGTNSEHTDVTLSGGAVFSNSGTYSAIANVNDLGGVSGFDYTLEAVPVSGSVFRITISTNVTITGTLTVGFVLVGS